MELCQERMPLTSVLLNRSGAALLERSGRTKDGHQPVRSPWLLLLGKKVISHCFILENVSYFGTIEELRNSKQLSAEIHFVLYLERLTWEP